MGWLRREKALVPAVRWANGMVHVKCGELNGLDVSSVAACGQLDRGCPKRHRHEAVIDFPDMPDVFAAPSFAPGISRPRVSAEDAADLRRVEQEAEADAAALDDFEEPTDGAWLALLLVLVAMGIVVVAAVAVMRWVRG